MEIGFADTTIPDPTRAELEDVLRGIAIDNVDRITVLRRIPGGRSGADVLDVELERRPTARIDRRVIKIDTLRAITEEWLAYQTNLASRPSTLITPVEAVSRRVLDKDPTPIPDRAAIVYHHAADYAATPNQPTRTLEDLVRDALHGTTLVNEVVGILDALLSRITAAFYSDATVDTKRTLQWMNPTLGPDITLEVDRADGPRIVKYQDPIPDALTELRRYQRDVLAAATGAPHRRISVDDTVYLRELSPDNLSAGTLTATWGDTTLSIQPAKPCAENLRLADLRTHQSFDIIGRVLNLRAHDHWQRIVRAWPTVKADSTGVGTTDTRVDHPFQLLHELLTEDLPGRPTALTHGDLNPRNALHIGDQIFLIDFAKTAPGRPLLSDFTWLETCLMRDVIAPDLDWPTLVLVQRTLAAASRLANLLPNPHPLEHLLGDNPIARAAFSILWSIRRHARAAYPAACNQPWWRDYLTHLTLSACRTLKWPDQDHTEPAAQAVVACTGVATEWLGSHPYRHWPAPDVVTLIHAAAPNLHTDADALAELVRAADTLPGPHDDLWHLLETARAAVTTATYADHARHTLVDLRDDHELFISLDAYIPLEGQLNDAQVPPERTKPRRRRPAKPDASTSPVRYGFGRHTSEDRAADQDDVIRLVTARSTVVVLGGAGSGKSTVARELQFQLATSVVNRAPHDDDLRPLMPVLVRASDVVAAIGQLGSDAPPGDVLRVAAHIPVSDAMLTIGAIHVSVDAFNELTAESKEIAARWVQAIGLEFAHTPVLVCHRTFEYDPELLPYPTVVLLPVTAGQARRYIVDMLRLSGIADAADRSAKLAHMLLDNPEHQQVQDLAKTPLFLWMLVKRYVETTELPSNIGALFADFAQWYLEERHHDRAGEYLPAPQIPHDIKVQVLENLGRYLVEDGNVTEIDEAVAIAMLGITDDVLNEIVGSEMLQRHGGSLRFMHQSFQEYFAARVFAREAHDERLLRDRAMVFAWREPLRIMLGFSGDKPELTERLMRIALRADPRFAAKLLRASETPPRTAVERFIAAQRQILTDPSAGEHDWEIAAEALADHGTPEARAALHGIATGDHPPAGRLAALTALVGESRGTKEDAGLAATVAALLTEGTPIPLREAAISAAGTKRLMSLTLDIGELIDEHAPWPVVNAVAETLQVLGMHLPDKPRRKYLRACEHRLLAVEEQLRQSASPSFGEMDALVAERRNLLERFAVPPRLDILLPRRFSYGVASDPRWSRWLSAPAARADTSLTSAVRHVLAEAVTTKELLAAFAGAESDESLVAAAAHRLIDDSPRTGVAPVSALLPHVDAGSSVTQLLAVAAAIPHSGSRGRIDAELAAVEALIRKILDQFREDLVEPLAALVDSLESDRRKKIVAANTVNEWFMDKDLGAIRARWPLTAMWRYVRPSVGEMSLLLLGDREQVAAGISLLASRAGLLDADPPPKILLTEQAQAVFDDFWESATPAQWATSGFQACATVGGFGYIDTIIAIAEDADPALTTPEMHTSMAFGAIEIVDFAFMLTSLGYLGQMAYRNEDLGAAQRAYDYLRQFDKTSIHPSVGTAKLVGLGYLGDWMPLLSALNDEDPLLHAAARNTIKLWVPGPFTPDGYREPEQVARWIVGELGRAELGAGARSTLGAIKEGLEGRLGRYVVGE